MIDRYTPLALGRGKTARNRIVVPPMASSTAAEDGTATERTVAHYARLAEAGAGITFVEYTYVHASGRSEPNQLGLASAEHAAPLARIAAVLKSAGTIAGIQLTHAGGKSERALTDGSLLAPSAVPVPVKDRVMETPSPLVVDAVGAWIQWFVTAAERAVAAGFELVELHAAHGYGFNQWLSPITNHRDDAYGGSPAARARILLETVQALRARLPDTLLAVRMPGKDFLAGGATEDDAVQLAQALIAAGVDLIDVSSGVGGWRRPADRTGEGYLVPEAAAVQRRIGAPVIGVGGIQTGDYIDQALAANSLSLAAVGRAILENPAAWREAHGSRTLRPEESA